MPFSVELDPSDLAAREGDHESGPRCRANSPRGNSDVAGTSYGPVKAVTRALAVLRGLSEMQHGSIADLHKLTGIPKPTIVRTLETLMSEGYVVRDNFSGGYRTTSQVQALSRGFAGVPLLIEAARVQAISLTEQIKWPVSIGTIVDGDVVVNFTTAPISPHGFPFPTLNRPFPVAATALGRCYMAFCSDEQRELLLQRTAATQRTVAATIAEIRSRGYALHEPHPADRAWEEVTRFQFVALPIHSDGQCIACLGVGFYKRAVQAGDVEAVIVEPARATVRQIEANIAFLKRSDTLAS